MSETINEVMENEVMTTEEPMDTEVLDYTEESEGGSGKALAAFLAFGAGVTALGIAAYKKLKAKKDEKPKKKTKKKLMWVEVPVEEEETEEDIVAESEATEVEEPEKETEKK
jgi:hypothetical protein